MGTVIVSRALCGLGCVCVFPQIRSTPRCELSPVGESAHQSLRELRGGNVRCIAGRTKQFLKLDFTIIWGDVCNSTACPVSSLARSKLGVCIFSCIFKQNRKYYKLCHLFKEI